MAVPPIQYRTTDYPPKYRPLGYWRHARRDAAPRAEAAPRDRFRRRFLILLAVLAATLVLHAGIASAYLGSGSDTKVNEKSSEKVDDPGASCDAEGQSDATTDPDALPEEENPLNGSADGTGSNDNDPIGQGGATRGAL